MTQKYEPWQLEQMPQVDLERYLKDTQRASDNYFMSRQGGGTDPWLTYNRRAQAEVSSRAKAAAAKEFNATPAVNIPAPAPGYAPLSGYAPIPGQGGGAAIPQTPTGQALRQPGGAAPVDFFRTGGRAPPGQAGNIDFFSEYI